MYVQQMARPAFIATGSAQVRFHVLCCLAAMGEVEAQLLMVWAASWIVAGVAAPPLVWMLEWIKAAPQSLSNEGTSLTTFPVLQLHGDFHHGHGFVGEWEIVDSGSDASPSSLGADTRMPVVNTSVPVLQQNVEDPDDDCYIVWSPGRRHIRAFPLHWRKRTANLSGHLHRIE